jgi:NAD(P)-dependent dehydrogenase (short-subunit alcohol dehydrogenase family)
MFHKMSEEQWKQVLEINLFGTYNCCRYVVPLMREQKYGKIVNISSSSARGNGGQANYSASKAAIEGFTKTLCKELAGRNITVNAIAPANIATDMLATIPDHLKAIAMMVSPIHRYGTSDELASAALFLSSDDSSYVNGVVLPVDGGMFT